MAMHESFELKNTITQSMSLRLSRFNSNSKFSQWNRYNHFAVILMQSSEGVLDVDTSEYDFKSGCLMSFSLYQPFKISCDSLCKGFIVEFHPDFFCLHKHRAEVSCNGILFNNIYSSPVTVLSDIETSELALVINAMLSELQRIEIDSEVLLSYLRILLINGSRIKIKQQAIDVQENKKLPDILTALQSAIELNFKAMHKAADYAKILHISQDNLNRLCKNSFNKTLLSLITDRVVLEAKRELYLTSKPVKTIGYEIGFTDEFHFSRYFKKNVTVSPQRFRETVGIGKANITSFQV